MFHLLSWYGLLTHEDSHISPHLQRRTLCFVHENEKPALRLACYEDYYDKLSNLLDAIRALNVASRELSGSFLLLEETDKSEFTS